MSHKIKVLFVCLGNICRSPMAEALFRQKVNNKGLADNFEIASAGTGAYHIGENADPRTLSTLKKNGINFTHKAQQASRNHFQEYNYIVAMDSDNLADLNLLAESPEAQKRLKLMLSYHSDETLKDVPDPYFGGDDGFDKVYDMLDAALNTFLNELIQEYHLAADAQA
jgi:protein-tyrosine phosphatase